MLAPKYSCRSDGEKNATNHAQGANPDGEFLWDTCEQEGRGPERGACGKGRSAFGESGGCPGKHYSLSDGEDKKPSSNDIPLLSEELQREQSSSHDQANTVNPLAGSLDTTFGDQRPYHSESPAQSETNNSNDVRGRFHVGATSYSTIAFGVMRGEPQMRSLQQPILDESAVRTDCGRMTGKPEVEIWITRRQEPTPKLTSQRVSPHQLWKHTKFTPSC